VIFGALVVIGLVPVWSGPDVPNWGLLLAGVAIVVNGTFDHLRLVRALGPGAPAAQPGGAGG
jgi:hypothetical protein